MSDSKFAVGADDKRVVNGQSDINQLMPLKYVWAWEFFLNANKNHWTPLDIPMGVDLADFTQKLSEQEQHIVTNVLSYLTTADILAMRNIGLVVMEKMSAPELQIYQARQVYEESLHTWAYQHCIETLGLDQAEIYNRYRVIPEIHGKIDLTNRRLERMLSTNINLKDRGDLYAFMMSYIYFACVFEGTFFYHGFTPIFSLQRRGLMRGTSEQLQYILRDETLHFSFGISVIKHLMIEENIYLLVKDLDTMWKEAYEAEEKYINYILPTPVFGYTVEEHMEQFKYVANKRMQQLFGSHNSYIPFVGAQNVIGWLDEQANIRKEKNFFETRVQEYQTGSGLTWE